MVGATGTAVRPLPTAEVRGPRIERATVEHDGVRTRPDLLGSGPAADLQARRLIAARRWHRRAEHAARRAARASASVR